MTSNSPGVISTTAYVAELELELLEVALLEPVGLLEPVTDSPTTMLTSATSPAVDAVMVAPATAVWSDWTVTWSASTAAWSSSS